MFPSHNQRELLDLHLARVHKRTKQDTPESQSTTRPTRSLSRVSSDPILNQYQNSADPDEDSEIDARYAEFERQEAPREAKDREEKRRGRARIMMNADTYDFAYARREGEQEDEEQEVAGLPGQRPKSSSTRAAEVEQRDPEGQKRAQKESTQSRGGSSSYGSITEWFDDTERLFWYDDLKFEPDPEKAYRRQQHESGNALDGTSGTTENGPDSYQSSSLTSSTVNEPKFRRAHRRRGSRDTREPYSESNRASSRTPSSSSTASRAADNRARFNSAYELVQQRLNKLKVSVQAFDQKPSSSRAALPTSREGNRVRREQKHKQRTCENCGLDPGVSTIGNFCQECGRDSNVAAQDDRMLVKGLKEWEEEDKLREQEEEFWREQDKLWAPFDREVPHSPKREQAEFERDTRAPWATKSRDTSKSEGAEVGPRSWRARRDGRSRLAATKKTEGKDVQKAELRSILERPGVHKGEKEVEKSRHRTKHADREEDPDVWHDAMSELPPPALPLTLPLSRSSSLDSQRSHDQLTRTETVKAEDVSRKPEGDDLIRFSTTFFDEPGSGPAGGFPKYVSRQTADTLMNMKQMLGTARATGKWRSELVGSGKQFAYDYQLRGGKERGM